MADSSIPVNRPLPQQMTLALGSGAGWRLHDYAVHFERRSSLDPHHGDLAETFLEAWRTQAVCHLAHDVIAHPALASAVPLHAYFQRNVEEDGLGLIAEALGHLDPLPAFVGREIGCVEVVPGHFRDQAGSQQRAERGKYKPLVALFGNVVKQD